jgi:hypothetical protein
MGGECRAVQLRDHAANDDWKKRLPTIANTKQASLRQRLQVLWAADAAPDELASLFRDGEAAIRREALLMIGGAIGTELGAWLAPLAEEQDPDVRIAAISALGAAS